MLNDYLQFAKTQAQESTTKINLNNLLFSIKEDLNNSKIFIEDDGNSIDLTGRPNSLKDHLKIIQNGLTYGDKAFVNIERK